LLSFEWFAFDGDVGVVCFELKEDNCELTCLIIY
jgi:hypothetical protein